MGAQPKSEQTDSAHVHLCPQEFVSFGVKDGGSGGRCWCRVSIPGQAKPLPQHIPEQTRPQEQHLLQQAHIYTHKCCGCGPVSTGLTPRPSSSPRAALETRTAGSRMRRGLREADESLTQLNAAPWLLGRIWGAANSPTGGFADQSPQRTCSLSHCVPNTRRTPTSPWPLHPAGIPKNTVPRPLHPKNNSHRPCTPRTHRRMGTDF